MNSPKKLARLAGLLYLMLIVCGIFAEFFVRAELLVPKDAAATIQKIQASEFLYRLGFVSDMFMLLAYFFLPLVFYILFKSVHQNYATLLVLCALMAVSTLSVNMLNHLAVLLISQRKFYFEGFDADQLNGLAMFFLDLHGKGYLIAQLFFGLWLLPLGLVVFKSGFLPKVIGIFLILGFVGYLIDFFIIFLFPSMAPLLSSWLTLPADLGEFSLCLWLLIKGI